MRFARNAAILSLLWCVAAASQEHPNVERGMLPDKAYELSDVDTINLFNGNVNITLPLGSAYPVNAGMSYQFSVSYAINPWEIGEREETFTSDRPPYEWKTYYHWSFPSRRINAGFGWMLTFGQIVRNDGRRLRIQVWSKPQNCSVG